MKITAHCLVKNEANFVWFALNSVADHVDQILIFDTGSSDGTWEIIEEFKKKHPQKTTIKKLVDQHFDEEKIRLQMLDATQTDWFMVLDGDEIWWDTSIAKVIAYIKANPKIESIVTPTINLIGDMYHFQEPQAGNYNLAGRIGHYNLRFVNRSIPGLSSRGEHGVWGWVDADNKMIQDRSKENIAYVSAPYLHATHLQRSSNRVKDSSVYKRSQKLKFELGTPFPIDFYYPESFFKPYPKQINSVWEKTDTSFMIRAMLETPLRKLKRRLLPKKVGY